MCGMLGGGRTNSPNQNSFACSTIALVSCEKGGEGGGGEGRGGKEEVAINAVSYLQFVAVFIECR